MKFWDFANEHPVATVIMFFLLLTVLGDIGIAWAHHGACAP